ncbi:MAG TPA: DUF4112 domain-containing protein [Rhodothermales bacterium]|nr:DUF4112 domain-containing protein [Rhodothermales bacterium]
MPRKADPALRTGDKSVQRIRRLAQLMDEAFRIPGIGYRVGLDSIIGLVPGAGDAASFLLSSYIIIEAARAGASPASLLRMVVNVALDTFIGSIPILGDIFDAVYKSNLRNVALLESHVNPETASRTASNRAFFIGLAVILLVLLAVVVAVVVFVISLILHLLRLT